MKKIYNTPEISTLFIDSKDVVTVSIGEDGTAKIISFNGIVNGEAGWQESDS